MHTAVAASPIAAPAPAATPQRGFFDRAVTGALGFANRVRATTAQLGERAASVVASRVDSAVARATWAHFAEQRTSLDRQHAQLQEGSGLRSEAHKILAGAQTGGMALRASTVAAWAIGGGALPALATYGVRAASTATKIAVQATSEQTRALSKDAQRAQFEAAVTAPSAGWRTKAGGMLQTVERELAGFTERVEQSKQRGEKVSALREVASLLAARQREEIWLTAEDGRLKASAVAAVTASALVGTLSTATTVLLGGRSVAHLIEQRELLLHAAERVATSTRAGLAATFVTAHELLEPSAAAAPVDPQSIARAAVGTPTARELLEKATIRTALPPPAATPTRAPSPSVRELLEKGTLRAQHPVPPPATPVTPLASGTPAAPTPHPSLRASGSVTVSADAPPLASAPAPAPAALNVLTSGTIQPCAVGEQPCTVTGLARALATRYAREHHEPVLPTRADFHAALQHGLKDGKPYDLRALNTVHPGDEVRLVRGEGGALRVEVLTRRSRGGIMASMAARARALLPREELRPAPQPVESLYAPTPAATATPTPTPTPTPIPSPPEPSIVTSVTPEAKQN